MDNKTKYAIVIAIALLASIAVYFMSRKDTPSATIQQQSLMPSLMPGNAEYVIEGFPIDNHITFFGPNSTLKDLGYLANDAGVSEWDVWSAARILTELKKVTPYTPYKLDDTASPSPSTIWSSDKIASVIASESGSNIIDDTLSSPTTVWSSNKIASSLAASGANLIADATSSPTLTWSSQNIAKQIQGLVNDTQTSPSQTWSSQQISSALSTAGKNLIDDTASSPLLTWSSDNITSKLQTAVKDVIATASSGMIDDASVSPATTWSSAKLDASMKNVPTVDDSVSETSTWSSQKTAAALDTKQNLTTGAKAGNVAFFDSTGQVVDKGVTLDDTAAPSASVVWSSEMTKNSLSKNQALVPAATANHVAAFDASGQVTDSGFMMNDAAASSPSVVWSSAKMLSATAAAVASGTGVSGAVAGNLASFDASGRVVDSLHSINDASPGAANVLWSSSAIDAKMKQKQNLVAPASKGRLASFDVAGQVSDSGVVVDDTAPAGANVVWSSQKLMQQAQPTVAPSAPGNLASLNASGQIGDSLYAVSDAAAASANVLWSSKKVSSSYQKLGSATTGAFVVFDATGQSIESGVKLDDTLASATNVWSAQKTASAFQAKASPSVAGNLAKLDGTGQVLDAGVAINDSAAPSAQVLWSSSKIANKQSLIASPVAGGLVSTDATGQTVMSPVKVDDAAAASTGVLWTSSKISTTIPTGTAKHVAVIGSSGSGVVDSGMKVDDAAAASPAVLWSSQKISAGLTPISDTTVSPATVWSSQQIQSTTAKKMDLVPAATANSLARFATGGQVESSGFVVDDTALSASALWSSLKTDATYQKLVQAAIAGDFATLNASGQVVDSGLKFSDTVVSKTTLSSSQYQYDNFTSRKGAYLDPNQYIVFEGIRFGISNPSGLTLQQDSATAAAVGAWTFNTCIVITAQFVPQNTWLTVPNSSSAPVKCTPTWRLTIPSVFDAIVRFPTMNTMYRVTGVVGTSFLKNYVVVEKL